MPTSFQVKLVGVTSVMVVTVLLMVTLVFFPPLMPTNILARQTQLHGLWKLLRMIVGTVAVVGLITTSDPARYTHPAAATIAGWCAAGQRGSAWVCH